MEFKGFGFTEARPELVHSIPIPACSRIGGELQHGRDLFKGMLVPDLQDDHFALIGGEFLKTSQGGPFRGSLLGRGFKPTDGFKLPGDAAEQGTVKI